MRLVTQHKIGDVIGMLVVRSAATPLVHCQAPDTKPMEKPLMTDCNSRWVIERQDFLEARGQTPRPRFYKRRTAAFWERSLSGFAYMNWRERLGNFGCREDIASNLSGLF